MPDKTVCHPIKVPRGKYCWDWQNTSHHICGHYDNSEGCDKCTLGFFPLVWEDFKGVLKPPECRDLKEVE